MKIIERVRRLEDYCLFLSRQLGVEFPDFDLDTEAVQENDYIEEDEEEPPPPKNKAKCERTMEPLPSKKKIKGTHC